MKRGRGRHPRAKSDLAIQCGGTKGRHRHGIAPRGRSCAQPARTLDVPARPGSDGVLAVRCGRGGTCPAGRGRRRNCGHRPPRCGRVRTTAPTAGIAPPAPPHAPFAQPAISFDTAQQLAGYAWAGSRSKLGRDVARRGGRKVCKLCPPRLPYRRAPPASPPPGGRPAAPADGPCGLAAQMTVI